MHAPALPGDGRGEPVRHRPPESDAGAGRRDDPGTVQAVALSVAPGPPPPGLSAVRVVAYLHGPEPYLLIPDPAPGMHRTLLRWLEGRSAAVGPVVPRADAGASLRWARTLLAMAPQWPGAAGELLFVEDHLAKVMLFQDPLLAGHLSVKWLGRLRDMTPRQRERTEQTLLAWLEGGGAARAALLLRIHPQTVRYRLRMLERLFGSSLRTSQARFEILLALKIHGMAAECARLRRRADELPVHDTFEPGQDARPGSR
ncbi:helix-turn-helix domain-containing protein [Kitasatospora sp. NBC_00240]|uniref:helix-turn-helix domain-containing protein n=1 Tax=Kitasatospora sp. NBC_00240 TaxID=2903567 RepID=UPI00224E8632|nr:helix-turn-helix domain-containing protein [Kitasatospora sp. NBC_00240]MCX5208550.1 helix-turn-helix domain-containing protein [Kitasatospora sp. NBC_00240]